MVFADPLAPVAEAARLQRRGCNVIQMFAHTNFLFYSGSSHFLNRLHEQQ